MKGRDNRAGVTALPRDRRRLTLAFQVGIFCFAVGMKERPGLIPGPGCIRPSAYFESRKSDKGHYGYYNRLQPTP